MDFASTNRNSQVRIPDDVLKWGNDASVFSNHHNKRFRKTLRKRSCLHGDVRIYGTNSRQRGADRIRVFIALLVVIPVLTIGTRTS